MTYRKKMLEVAIPLDAINNACKPETENPFLTGHPRSLHNWWARLPLVACRAVLFTSLIDDPGEPGVPQALLDRIDALAKPPDVLPDDDETEVRRKKLFHFIGELVKWKNTTNETVINTARELILAATDGNPPPVLDPFCGRGSIPLEAQRLGLQVYASDLNPVAVLITKALIEIPPKFAGRPPVNPDDRKKIGAGSTWKGAAGLAADVRYYGKWMRDRAFERIGHLYPKGPNGETVIAWLWARTVRCPNPACGGQMPLVRSFWLSTKRGKEAWVEPLVDKAAKTVRFEVRTGKGEPRPGTKERAKIECLLCEASVSEKQLREQASRHGYGESLMAIVTEGDRRRNYIAPAADQIPTVSRPETRGLEAELPNNPRWFSPPAYGLKTYASLFTPRQLVALTTFSDLVGEARALVREHAAAAGMAADGAGIDAGGTGADAYADAVATYLGMAVSRLTDYHSTICTWNPPNENVRNVFVRQAIPMAWDYAEANPCGQELGIDTAAGWVAAGLRAVVNQDAPVGHASQLDTTQALPPVANALVCTDPPYYDNIGYADLSDYFYCWLRPALKAMHPPLFSTVQTPKDRELVASPYRWPGGADEAEQWFRGGLHKAFANVSRLASEAYPVTIYYAYKQAEDSGDGKTSSTGWETMLSGLIRNRLAIVGTWPLRTTKAARAVARDTNALATAVVLVCRLRPEDAPLATLREFQAALKTELPAALHHMIGGHIAPVDLAQAAIGPGMGVFSRYSRVIEPNGDDMTVRRALELINAAVEEYFSEREGAFDAYTQFCARWFEQHRFNDGPYGQAEDLARAKNVAVGEIARDGLLESGQGKVRLWPLTYYIDHLESYDPSTDRHVTAWEACHYLIAALRKGGVARGGRLAHRLGGVAAQGVELSYRLYAICERNKWSEEALGYNELADSWADIQAAMASPEQGQMV